MLHIVNKSATERNSLESCLRMATQGSAVLLIEDAVYAASQGNAAAAKVQASGTTRLVTRRRHASRKLEIWLNILKEAENVRVARFYEGSVAIILHENGNLSAECLKRVCKAVAIRVEKGSEARILSGGFLDFQGR